MAEKAVRKTTAKKTTTKVAPKKTASRTVPKRTTTITPTTKARSVATAVTTDTRRKAPTQIAAASQQSSRGSKLALGAFLFFCIALGASVGIGFSDSGQINIQSNIAQQQLAATSTEAKSRLVIPVQQTDNTPNGGLEPSGTPVTPPPVVATSTATTTAKAVSTTTPTTTQPAKATSTPTS